MTAAFGTSMPTSITVVDTSTCTSPAANARMTRSFSSWRILPCTSARRYSGNTSAARWSAISVAARTSTFDDSSTSGYTTYAWRPASSARRTIAYASSRRDWGSACVSTGARPGGSSRITDTSRSP